MHRDARRPVRAAIVTRGRLLGLAVCGALLLALTATGLWTQRQKNIDAFVAVAVAQGGVYLAALWLAARVQQRSLVFVVAVAVTMRLLVLFAPPYLSTDIYRYVWDGRVIAAGINPYRYIPIDPHLTPLRDDNIFPRINRNTYARTIYPPGAEAMFFTLDRVGGGITTVKAAMVLCEAVAVALLLLAGLPAARVVVYAWHPLPLWEFAGSGHVDSVAIALMALALWAGTDAAAGGRTGRTRWLAAAALAGATLVKFYPAVLLPGLWRRDWRVPAVFVAVMVLAYLPFLDVGWHVLGFLPRYVEEEGFTGGGGGFYLWSLARAALPLGGVSDLLYIAVAALLGAGLAAYVAFGRVERILGATLLAGAFIVLLSPHYPWYFAWLVLFAALVPSAALLWLTLASFLLYLTPVGSQLVWDRRRFVVESVLYLPALLLAAIALWRHRRREQPRHGDSQV